MNAPIHEKEVPIILVIVIESFAVSYFYNDSTNQ